MHNLLVQTVANIKHVVTTSRLTSASRKDRSSHWQRNEQHLPVEATQDQCEGWRESGKRTAKAHTFSYPPSWSNPATWINTDLCHPYAQAEAYSRAREQIKGDFPPVKFPNKTASDGTIILVQKFR